MRKFRACATRGAKCVNESEGRLAMTPDECHHRHLVMRDMLPRSMPVRHRIGRVSNFMSREEYSLFSPSGNAKIKSDQMSFVAHDRL
jgi:hypothetical protein